jgi:CBS domain-containing protein
MTSPVISVREDTSMSEAAHLMVTKRISGLPVIDQSEHLVGIITEADFLCALGIPTHQPYHNLWQTLETMLFHLSHHAELDNNNHTVADHMTREVVCADADKDIHHIVELMKKHKVKRILVCDEHRKVLGIITRSNLVRLFFDQYSDSR